LIKKTSFVQILFYAQNLYPFLVAKFDGVFVDGFLSIKISGFRDIEEFRYLCNLVQRAEQQLKQIQRQKMEATGQELMKELSNVPEFKELLKKITIEYTEDGMRIEIIETDDVFFEIGTSKLKRAAAELLKKIGENLAKKNNKIVLEGHTDSRPFPGSGFGYTNFELSADRANASRRGLLAGGVTNNQIDEIRGFADKRLRDAKDPYSASNRRISILVKYDKTY